MYTTELEDMDAALDNFVEQAYPWAVSYTAVLVAVSFLEVFA